MQVLVDVLMAMDGAPGAHWTTLAARLAEREPDRWAGTSSEIVSAVVRTLGVPSVMVSTAGVKARGCRRADLAVALADPADLADDPAESSDPPDGAGTINVHIHLHIDAGGQIKVVIP
jgi:hypothetical protein